MLFYVSLPRFSMADSAESGFFVTVSGEVAGAQVRLVSSPRPLL